MMVLMPAMVDSQRGYAVEGVVSGGAPTLRGSILGPAKMRGCCDMGVCLLDAGW